MDKLKEFLKYFLLPITLLLYIFRGNLSDGLRKVLEKAKKADAPLERDANRANDDANRLVNEAKALENGIDKNVDEDWNKRR